MERLRQIATEMKTQAAATGHSQRTLPHGLTLTLRKVGPQYTLSLTRKVGQASEAERSICREAFGCPDIPKTDLEHYQIEYRNGYGIIRFVWQGQAEQGRLFEVEQPENYFAGGL